MSDQQAASEFSLDTTSGSTSGMTKKVIRGSFWVLLGQVLPLVATFISTPFVIRFLGTEGYGVLILIGMVSGYFSFADFGMGLASTKLGAEAFAKGDKENESRIIQASATIALFSSLLVAIPLFFLSDRIVDDIFKVPNQYRVAATVAMRLTAIAFVIGILSSVINTPQLSRLRMDVNVLINAGTKVLMIFTTPLVLYFGGELVAATLVSLACSILALAGHFYFSNRLLPGFLFFRSFESRPLFLSLIKFGKNVALYSAAFVLIFNVEKLILGALVTPDYLAYYSVAYTLANFATMFTLAVGQTLIPAFSQLLEPNRNEELNLLFSRTFRGSIFILLPVTMFLFLIAEPFFTAWAGADFGRESISPFFILMAGVFISINMYIPNSILLAYGKTRLFARIYWFEMIPYLLLAYVLISELGILGAAIAWSIREIFNAALFYLYSRKLVRVSYNFGISYLRLFVCLIILSIPVLIARFHDNYSFWLFLVVPISLFFYFLIAWRSFIRPAERQYLLGKLFSLLPNYR